jgi:quinohemoprotein ethanol dehydrogenase
MSNCLVGVLASAILGSAFAQQSSRVDQNALKRAAAQPNEWLTYGRDYAETHYSPLKEINDKNVGRLGLGWSWETGTVGSFEGTPLIADGIIYGTGSWSVVFAVDARTGKEKWRWDPDVDRSFGSHACCGPNNRGVAIYDGKVFVGVLDGRLAALDQETGKKIWSVKTTEDDYQRVLS